MNASDYGFDRQKVGCMAFLSGTLVTPMTVARAATGYDDNWWSAALSVGIAVFGLIVWRIPARSEADGQ